MNDDITRFFSHSPYCKPEVLRRIVVDIDTITSALRLSRRVTTWGTTQQPKLCLYGGLPVNFSRSDTPGTDNGQQTTQSGGSSGGSSRGNDGGCVLPIQIWLTHQYPVEPPTMYLVATGFSEPDGVPWSCNNAVIKIAGNHPNVDLAGLCYVKELAQWKPTTSSLCLVVERFGRALERSGVCPLYVQSRFESNKTQAANATTSPQEGKYQKDVDSGSDTDRCVVCYEKRDTVLVPCGHFCLCGSCAANVIDCPMCRTKIKVRQYVFS